MEMWGVSSVGLWVGGNYVWCLVIVVIFMGLGRSKEVGREEVLKSSYGGNRPQRGGPIFMGRVDLCRHSV